MIFSALALAVLVAGDPAEVEASKTCADRAGFEAGTVGNFGGSQRNGDQIYVLDAADKPSLALFQRENGPILRIPLGKGEQRLESAGLAWARNRNLCALSLRGRDLVCFDPRSGERTWRRPLPVRTQGIWNVAGSMAYAPYETESNNPFLTGETDSETLALSAVHSNSGATPVSALMANLFNCGAGPIDRTPCWFFESMELMIVTAGKAPERIPVPRVPGLASRYPIRNALLTDNLLWLLVNDPPAEKERPAGDARRLLRFEWKTQTVRTYPLPRPARAVLDGDARNALVFFRDGSAARCGDAPPGAR